jgi:hypothetical protein
VAVIAQTLDVSRATLYRTMFQEGMILCEPPPNKFIASLDAV